LISFITFGSHKELKDGENREELIDGIDPNPEDIYLDNCQIGRPAKWAADVDAARRLWEVCEKMTEFVIGRDGGRNGGSNKL
jgi:hypothetical protein